MVIPENFKQTMFRIYGQKGLDWLDTLPSLLDEFSQRWSLTLLPPFEPFSYNYIVPAITAEGRDAVLKTGFPNPELLTEIYALRHYAGQGSVQLLESNTEKQIMLLERIRPGENLFDSDDDQQSTLIAAQLMQQLWKPVAEEQLFPTTTHWMRNLFDLQPQTTPVDNSLIDIAQQLTKALLVSEANFVLLHGDLHHWNILSAERQPWLAIDPKGIVGEPIFDISALLRNPVSRIISMPDFADTTRLRLNILAEVLGFEKKYMLQWSLAQAVLSAQWSYEMGAINWQAFEVSAHVFYEILAE
jgi:streptomycin 6-kinase